MADRNVKGRRTGLTALINDVWKLSGESQFEFVTKLLGSESAAEAFGKQTLSKFINGRLAEPPDGLIEAFAAKTGKSVDELKVLAAQPLKPVEARGTPAQEHVPLKFLVGHTVWAATFLAAMLDPDEGPDEVKFASFGTLTEDGNSIDPRWLDSKNEPDQTPAPAVENGLVPLAAPDVIQLMTKDMVGQTDQVCFGIIPGELVRDQKGHDGRFVRIATLVDAAAACVVIVPENANLGPGAVSSSDVADWLSKSTAEGGRAFVLAETGTVAVKRANRITSIATSGKRASFKRQDLRTRDLLNLSWQEISEKHGSAKAIIAWDPHASWFVSNCKNGAKRLPLLHLPESGKWAQQLTFEICLYIPTERDRPQWESWAKLVGRAVKRVFREVLPAIQNKQDSMAGLYSRTNPADDLNRLGRYFGFLPYDDFKPDATHLSTEEIEEVFASIRYSASADPRGLKSAWFPF